MFSPLARLTSRKTNPGSTKASITTAEVRDLVRSQVTADFSVEVPEQNPIRMGNRKLYRVRMVDKLTNDIVDAHVSVSDRLDESTMEFVKLKFPRNPFKTAAHIETIAA